MSRIGYLVLQNGQIFKGELFGTGKSVIGEIVFTTGMVGYLETLTDKSFYGQIVIQSFPLIGNYGVIPSDFESDKINASGYVIKELCSHPSNFRSEKDLNTFFIENNKLGICGLDTRTLVKILRDNGTMNAMITDDLSSVDMEAIKNFQIIDSVKTLSVKEAIVHNADGVYNVVLWDFGAKDNIVRELIKRDCRVTIVPHDTTAEQILSYTPDGIMLSNGPGDPAENIGIINELKNLIPYKIPTFGICLGHQLLAIANGFKTEKIKYGHRGPNQPVHDIEINRVHMTSQNHGYAVVKDTIKKAIGNEFLVNVNDNSNEGIRYPNANAFTCQFHPEACCGPHDTRYLFDEFIKLMKENKQCH